MQLYINNKGAWEVKNAFFVFFLIIMAQLIVDVLKIFSKNQ